MNVMLQYFAISAHIFGVLLGVAMLLIACMTLGNYAKNKKKPEGNVLGTILSLILGGVVVIIFCMSGLLY